MKEKINFNSFMTTELNGSVLRVPHKKKIIYISFIYDVPI